MVDDEEESDEEEFDREDNKEEFDKEVTLYSSFSSSDTTAFAF